MTLVRMLAVVLVLAGGALILGSAAAAQRSGAKQGAKPSPVASAAPTVSPPSPSAAPSPTPRMAGTTFVIVMENRSLESALQSPYIASLAQRYALATNYHSISSPSLPNYLALTSGSTWGVTDDNYRVLPPGGLGAQLTSAGVSWKAYTEGLTGDCLGSPYPYAVKHDPFAFYGGTCPANIVPGNQLQTDLAANDMPRLAWIIPDLCNDGHDCSSATADHWLSLVVPTILRSPSYQDSGALFLTWDEGDSPASNTVPLIVAAPLLARSTTAIPYNHYSLLATIEDRLGVPRLGNAGAASPIADLIR